MSGKEIVVVPRDVWEDLALGFDNIGSSLQAGDLDGAGAEFDWLASRIEDADVVTAREANLTTTDV